jgi:hypothetical protein
MVRPLQWPLKIVQLLSNVNEQFRSLLIFFFSKKGTHIHLKLLSNCQCLSQTSKKCQYSQFLFSNKKKKNPLLLRGTAKTSTCNKNSNLINVSLKRLHITPTIFILLRQQHLLSKAPQIMHALLIKVPQFIVVQLKTQQIMQA